MDQQDVTAVLAAIGAAGAAIGPLAVWLTSRSTNTAASERHHLDLSEARRSRLHDNRVELHSAVLSAVQPIIDGLPLSRRAGQDDPEPDVQLDGLDGVISRIAVYCSPTVTRHARLLVNATTAIVVAEDIKQLNGSDKAADTLRLAAISARGLYIAAFQSELGMDPPRWG